MADSKKFQAKKQYNLMDKAYDSIKANICNNTIESGMLLSESQIAEELGMSRTPVREALKALAMEGYVEIRVGIGAYVKPISYRELLDLYAVRRALEIAAVDTALENITEDEVDDLEERFNELLKRYRNHEKIELQEFINVDLALHELLVEKCENRYIKDFMEKIMDNIRRIQMVSFRALNDLEESTQQHLDLLEHIRARDKQKLSEALARHMDWSISCIKAF
jgi:DNA-binding GntR family transcriptional regulator